MTTDQRFDRDLPDLLAQLAPRVTPDYRDDVVRQTTSLRQRPAWTFPERWLPVDFALSPARGRPRSVALLLAALVVALLIGAMLIAYAGSSTRVPAPFGPAENGSLYFSADGDIFTIDSLTSTPRSIVAGDPRDEWPQPSRDGRLLKFEREVAGGTQIVIANADGSNSRALPGTYAELSEVDWSPTGEDIAVISTVRGRPALTILPVDGSAPRTYEPGTAMGSFWYLPDGRMVFKGATGQSYGMYILDPADGEPHIVGSTTALESDIIDPNPSPDGRRVVYHRWREPDELGRIRIMDLEQGTDEALAVTLPDEEFNDEGAQFSPDGSHVAFTRYLAAGNQIMVASVAGGPAVAIGEVAPGNENASFAYSPDGASILAFYPASRQLWLLDPTGKTSGRQLDLPVTDTPTWQRKG